MAPGPRFAACVLAQFVALSAAHAESKVLVLPVVAVYGEAKEAAAVEMTKAIVEALAQSDELDAVAGAEPRDTAPAESSRRPARPDSEYRAALEALDAGKQHALKLRFPQAITALKKGIEGFLRNAELATDYEPFFAAHVTLAEAYFRRGKESLGADVLAELVRLNPTYELDAERYPPVFIKVFEEARLRALRRTRGSVHVTSAPAGCEVLVNGRSMGTTPLTVDSVPPGLSAIVVRYKDARWGELVEVREDSVSEVPVDLGAGEPGEESSAYRAGIAANRFDRDVRRLARAAAKEAGADFVLVTGLGMGDRLLALGGFIGNARTGKWGAIDPLAPDLDLLSASVDADKLARDLAGQLKAFRAPVVDDTIEVIAGKKVAAKRQPLMRERRAAFVPAEVDARLGAAPVVVAAVPAPPPPPEPKPVPVEQVEIIRGPVAAEAPAQKPVTANRPLTRESPRTPVAASGVAGGAQARAPVTPGGAAEDAVVDPPLEVVPQGRAGRAGPLTRSSPRGPIVSDAVGIDRTLDASSVEAARVAAGEPYMAGSPVDIQAEAFVEEPFWNTWWFWTAVGAGTVAAAGGVYWFFIHDRPVDSVSVNAVW